MLQIFAKLAAINPADSLSALSLHKTGGELRCRLPGGLPRKEPVTELLRNGRMTFQEFYSQVYVPRHPEGACRLLHCWACRHPWPFSPSPSGRASGGCCCRGRCRLLDRLAGPRDCRNRPPSSSTRSGPSSVLEDDRDMRWVGLVRALQTSVNAELDSRCLWPQQRVPPFPCCRLPLRSNQHTLTSVRAIGHFVRSSANPARSRKMLNLLLRNRPFALEKSGFSKMG